jgi:hypothetical protein
MVNPAINRQFAGGQGFIGVHARSRPLVTVLNRYG